MTRLTRTNVSLKYERLGKKIQEMEGDEDGKHMVLRLGVDMLKK
jgi:hypothetical protein